MQSPHSARTLAAPQDTSIHHPSALDDAVHFTKCAAVSGFLLRRANGFCWSRDQRVSSVAFALPVAHLTTTATLRRAQVPCQWCGVRWATPCVLSTRDAGWAPGLLRPRRISTQSEATRPSKHTRTLLLGDSKCTHPAPLHRHTIVRLTTPPPPLPPLLITCRRVLEAIQPHARCLHRRTHVLVVHAEEQRITENDGKSPAFFG